MGMFNSVIYTCPKCKCKIENQTKSGSCELETYPHYAVPPAELEGLDTIMICDECGAKLDLIYETPPEVYTQLIIHEDNQT